MSMSDFVDALATKSSASRAESLERWRLQLQEHDIETVQELKMVMAQVARQMFTDAQVGDGAQAMIRLALAPQTSMGWAWTSATRAVNSAVKKGDDGKAPTWDTSAKYTRASFRGDINQFVFPDGSFDEWPPCEVLPFKDMMAVGNRAWTLINTHPELKGGGLTTAAARRLATLLGARYKALEPIGKHEARNGARHLKLSPNTEEANRYVTSVWHIQLPSALMSPSVYSQEKQASFVGAVSVDTIQERTPGHVQELEHQQSRCSRT